jgi:hypothetical protein
MFGRSLDQGYLIWSLTTTRHDLRRQAVPTKPCSMEGFRTMSPLHVNEQIGFDRCPEFDLQAADMLGVDEDGGTIDILAYRLDLRSGRTMPLQSP